MEAKWRTRANVKRAILWKLNVWKSEERKIDCANVPLNLWILNAKYFTHIFSMLYYLWNSLWNVKQIFMSNIYSVACCCIVSMYLYIRICYHRVYVYVEYLLYCSFITRTNLQYFMNAFYPNMHQHRITCDAIQHRA